MRLSGVKASNPINDFRIPSVFCTCFRIRLYADKQSIGERDALICR